MTTLTPEYDQEKLEAAIGRFLNDIGSIVTAASVINGHKMGLYKALAAGGAQTCRELAQRTRTHERYLEDWLANQTAAGYLRHNPLTQRFAIPLEHVPLLADDRSELMMCDLFGLAKSFFGDVPNASDSRLHALTDRVLRSAYGAHLIQEWIPALDGVEDKLRVGAIVADVGCGYGTSAILMAKAYPASRFVGFDEDDSSIQAARKAAREAGVAHRVRFETASVKALYGKFDLVCFLDFRGMGDPSSVLARIRQVLLPNGTFMMVQPVAKKPQNGEEQLHAAVLDAGFSQFRRAVQTPFNIVYEAWP